jgi:hypothetical protein
VVQARWQGRPDGSLSNTVVSDFQGYVRVKVVITALSKGDPIVKYASESQAKAAYLQFASEPHPEGFEETYPTWEELAESNRELWHRIATAAINGETIQ